MVEAKKAVKTKKTKQVSATSLSVVIYGLDGRQKEKVQLPKEMFSEKEVNNRLLAQYMRVFLVNQRQGNASAKTRGEVIGSTAKIYRQKGLGRARHGSRKAPIFVGGGVVGGPRPKNYELKMNKKQKKKAFFYALTSIHKKGGIVGLTDASLKMEAKTKKIADFLKKVKLNDKKTLLVLPQLEKNNLVLAARNIPRLVLKDAKSLNTYDVISAQSLIFVKSSLQVLKDHFVKHEN